MNRLRPRSHISDKASPSPGAPGDRRSVSGYSTGSYGANDYSYNNNYRDFSANSTIQQDFTQYQSPSLPPVHSEASSPSLDINSDNASVTSSVLAAAAHKRNITPRIEFPKDTPLELIPILTLLSCQQQRVYYEGYFMLLADLNADGKPSQDRKWVEVFGKLEGNVLSIWDAETLNKSTGDKEPTPNYINVTDSTFKSIASLPSPSGDLSNIIVLSTTMKNRYLLQFATAKLIQEWTAALRLSAFEYASLQEAYTGALLSSKGSKLNGIRTLLAETKFKHEDWVRVRFGSGMPWRKCWTVVTPADMKTKKKQPAAGTIAFYEDKKKSKKPPLAVITSAWAAFAVYPEKSILVNGSTLIKIEGKVTFMDVPEPKDTSIFLMPEQHPGVLGFETLIRFLIPVLDVFKLYGRPKRLNADKSDVRSLLFGMPSLPRTQYLEVLDLVMLVGVTGSDKWTTQEWTKNIRDLLARKMSTGYKGTGIIKFGDDELFNSPSSRDSPRSRQRSISNPVPVVVPGVSPQTPSERSPMVSQTDLGQPIPPQHSVNGQNQQSPLSQNYQTNRSAPTAPPHAQHQAQTQAPPQNQNQNQNQNPGQGHSALMGPPLRKVAAPMAYATSEQPPQQTYQPGPGPQGQGRPYQADQGQGQPQGRYHEKAPVPLQMPQRPILNRERSASVGTDPNNLIGKVTGTTGPYSPNIPTPGAEDGFPQSHSATNSRPTTPLSSRQDMRQDLFDPTRQVSGESHTSPPKQKISRRPVSSEFKPPPGFNPSASASISTNSSSNASSSIPKNIFDPTATLNYSHDDSSLLESPHREIYSTPHGSLESLANSSTSSLARENAPAPLRIPSGGAYPNSRNNSSHALPNPPQGPMASSSSPASPSTLSHPIRTQSPYYRPGQSPTSPRGPSNPQQGGQEYHANGPIPPSHGSYGPPQNYQQNYQQGPPPQSYPQNYQQQQQNYQPNHQPNYPQGYQNQKPPQGYPGPHGGQNQGPQRPRLAPGPGSQGSLHAGLPQPHMMRDPRSRSPAPPVGPDGRLVPQASYGRPERPISPAQLQQQQQRYVPMPKPGSEYRGF